LQPYPRTDKGKTTYFLQETSILHGSESSMLRGGSFLSQALDLRCAKRSIHRPDRSIYDGFRLARTFAP
jgi:hypothetical protein